MTNTSVHIHLYYEDTGLFLLKELNKIWHGKIFLSLTENNCANDIIINSANGLFEEIDLTITKNKGTDQYGFYKTFQKNKDDTKWILYWHDKHMSKKSWLDDLINIFLDQENDKLISRLTNNISNCGIISSRKHAQDTVAAEELIKYDMPFSHRHKIVRSLQTLIWLKELQYLLCLKHNLTHDKIHPFFCAGNIFLIRRSIVEKAHSVIHENFFEDFYREDGDVGHGLERFYYYVSNCMNFKNKFI